MKLTKDTMVEDVYYEYFYSREDIVSTIFNALGWFHTRKWTKEDDAISKTIQHLIEECLKTLRKGEKESECATGGLRVELWLEEDNEITAQLSIEL